LEEAKIETKEDSVMKEAIKEMENHVPILQHAHHAKDVSLAMMVSINFAIPKKLNVPIG
jgi:hypothetical protein